MYYDFTPAEAARVQLAAFFGIKVDPVGYVDLAAVVVYSLVLFVGLCANIYVWCNRHYAPLKAKNIPLMTGIYLHSVFFFLGDLTLCGMVHVRGPFFGNCTLMLIWLRSMMGNFSLGSLLTIRSYKLYRVFCMNKPMHGYNRAMPYVLYIALILVAGTISTIIPKHLTVDYIEGVEFCIDNPNLVTSYCSVLWFMWCIYFMMMWLLRNVRSSFNEFREMAISLGLLVFCTIFNQAVLYCVPRLPTSLSWRLALLSVDQITANYIWWLIMLKPIYKCVFHHDKYLAQWKQKMTADGLRAQYGMGMGETEMSTHSNTLVNSHQDTVSSKAAESNPSYTESTRLAINRLAALSESCQGRIAATAAGWEASESGDTVSGEDYFYRHSISFAQKFERRKSEPFVSAGATSTPETRGANLHERGSKYRMLTQRVLSHHDAVEMVEETGGISDSVLVDFGLPDTRAQDTISLQESTSPECAQQKPPARSSEIHRWQRSDTDLSLLSSGCSGGRRLL
ncbi:hypothetical protein GGI20_001660 [Coemansia sp. BCRC 34301]|nr:hypothetical protein GGI20_001660 [Coemansia sp. BCRC 34301]